jgi:hypothetical protein
MTEVKIEVGQCHFNLLHSKPMLRGMTALKGRSGVLKPSLDVVMVVDPQTHTTCGFRYNSVENQLTSSESIAKYFDDWVFRKQAKRKNKNR